MLGAIFAPKETGLPRPIGLAMTCKMSMLRAIFCIKNN